MLALGKDDSKKRKKFETNKQKRWADPRELHSVLLRFRPGGDGAPYMGMYTEHLMAVIRETNLLPT